MEHKTHTETVDLTAEHFIQMVSAESLLISKHTVVRLHQGRSEIVIQRVPFHLCLQRAERAGTGRGISVVYRNGIDLFNFHKKNLPRISGRIFVDQALGADIYRDHIDRGILLDISSQALLRIVQHLLGIKSVVKFEVDT